jgi:adenylylsulfate kinase-like enzyme
VSGQVQAAPTLSGSTANNAGQTAVSASGGFVRQTCTELVEVSRTCRYPTKTHGASCLPLGAPLKVHMLDSMRKQTLNTIIFITGAPGAGKSTIGRLIAEHFSKGLLIQVDELRGMMVKGFASADGGWTEDAFQQFQLARSTTIYMAQLYASQGVDVVVDDVCVPESFVEQYATLFENPAVHRVLLFPKIPALIKRIEKRAGPWDKILIDRVPKIYSYLEPMTKDGWIVLDSTEWTIEQTVHEVLSRITVVSDNAQS